MFIPGVYVTAMEALREDMESRGPRRRFTSHNHDPQQKAGAKAKKSKRKAAKQSKRKNR